jgi:TPR repeat protein
VEKDLGIAAKWFESSAEQGFAKSQHALGIMYLQGLGVKENLEEAKKWLGYAANQGETGAREELEKIN